MVLYAAPPPPLLSGLYHSIYIQMRRGTHAHFFLYTHYSYIFQSACANIMNKKAQHLFGHRANCPPSMRCTLVLTLTQLFTRTLSYNIAHPQGFTALLALFPCAAYYALLTITHCYKCVRNLLSHFSVSA